MPVNDLVVLYLEMLAGGEILQDARSPDRRFKEESKVIAHLGLALNDHIIRIAIVFSICSHIYQVAVKHPPQVEPLAGAEYLESPGATVVQGESPFAQGGAEWRAQALANFPFEIVETSGESAFATWKELKTAGRGVPVVVGADVGNVLEPFHPQGQRRSVAEILSAG